MEATKRFTADAGHELRTPLTGLGADLETLRRNPGISADKREEMLEAMGAEHQRIVRLLDGLQSLARGDSEVLPGREAVEVSEILREAVIAARRRYPRVTFQLTPPSEPAVLECWSDGLRLAIDNLLSNAAIHGKPDGLVEASVEVTEETMVLAVADDGPGVDASLRQRVVSRFSRGPEPRGCGSGLGLSIVEQQARLLEGALSLGESDAGGLSAQITLPRGNQPSSGKS
jgi:signal transduction histidine kinase